MIENYVKKLVNQMPMKDKNTVKTIDLVLDGGTFNGSYEIGILYFLKEMQNNDKIKIDRISGCSVGSLCALLFYMNRLDLSISIYNQFIKHFKKYKNISILHSFIDKNLRAIIPENFYITLKNKLYISYYNLKTHKKKVKCNYKNTTDLLNTIKRSCFYPIFLNGDLVYKKKYLDGMNPYIFDINPNKKILYVDLFGYDKLGHIFSVKNERSNIHRVLSGVLDVHLFFIKKSPSQMCSYVNDWSAFSCIKNRFVKYIFEVLTCYIVFIIIYLMKYIPPFYSQTLISKIIKKIIRNVYILIIDHYCL